VDAPQKYLIVGLGNPGAAYTQTRHNVGFNIVQSFAHKHGMQFRHASHLMGEMAQGGRSLALLPATFMNASGDAVRRTVDYFKVPLDHLIVVCDDVALPLGTVRIRSKGSCGGHNGLKSIETELNTQYYARLRIGVGAPPDHQVLADYVLGRFTEEEDRSIQEVASFAIKVLDLWIESGISAAMQVANSSKQEGEKNG